VSDGSLSVLKECHAASSRNNSTEKVLERHAKSTSSRLIIGSYSLPDMDRIERKIEYEKEHNSYCKMLPSAQLFWYKMCNTDNNKRPYSHQEVGKCVHEFWSQDIRILKTSVGSTGGNTDSFYRAANESNHEKREHSLSFSCCERNG
jgi:hypothetical protein